MKGWLWSIASGKSKHASKLRVNSMAAKGIPVPKDNGDGAQSIHFHLGVHKFGRDPFHAHEAPRAGNAEALRPQRVWPERTPAIQALRLAVLSANFAQHFGRQMIEKLEQFWNNWLDRLQPSSADKQNDNGDRQRSDVLLVLQIPIRCDEDIVPSGRQREELAVFEARPTCCANGCGLVPQDQWRKILRQ